MNLSRAQLDAIINALTVVLPARATADSELRQFFRDNKNLGHRDRGVIADTVYAALRRRRLLEHVTPNATPREMALDLTYTALASHKVDVIAGNSTDGRIAALDLVQLEDDRRYFPPYEAVFLTRGDALTRVPALAEVLQKLGGAISTDEMRKLNYEVDGARRDKKVVVHEWLAKKGFIH